MASGIGERVRGVTRVQGNSVSGSMMRPTSSPEVNSRAMKPISDSGIGPSSRRPPMHATIAAEVSSVTRMAAERMACSTRDVW